MCKYKVGDKVLFFKKDQFINEDLTIGNTYSVVEVCTYLPLCGLIDDSGDLVYVNEYQIEILNKHKKSNRYKLQQSVKKSGFTAKALSLVAGKNKYYFGTDISESRFNLRGDLSDKQYNAMNTNLEFAIRELSGIGAKTVEESKPTTIEDIQSNREEDHKQWTSENHSDDSRHDAMAYVFIDEKQAEKKLNLGLICAVSIIAVLLFILVLFYFV